MDARAVSRVVSILVMLGLSVFLTPAVAQTLYPIELSCAEPEKGIDPSRVCEYSVTITNKGIVPTVQECSVELTLSAVPEGWSASITPDKVNIDAGESMDVAVLVTAPSKAHAGESIKIVVTGVSSGTVPEAGETSSVNITAVVNVVYNFEVQSPPAANAKRNETILCKFVIQNNGNTDDTFSVMCTSPAGWSVNWSRKITVPAYSSKDLTASVRIPADVDEGMQSITLEITNNAGETKKASAQIYVQAAHVPSTSQAPDIWVIFIPLLPWVIMSLIAVLLLILIFWLIMKKKTTIRLICDRFQRDVVPGGGALYNMRIENMGKTKADVDVSVPKVPDGWQVELEYKKFHLNAGESKDFKLLVKPQNAKVGDEVEITLIARIEGTNRYSFAKTRTKLVDRMDYGLVVTGILNKPSKPQPKDGVRTEVFVQNKNLSDQTATVKFFVNDEMRGSKRLTVPAGRTIPAKFFWICSKVENKLGARIEAM